MCVCYVTVSRKMLVTKYNEQSHSSKQSKTLEEMGAERPEILVRKNQLGRAYPGWLHFRRSVVDNRNTKTITKLPFRPP